MSVKAFLVAVIEYPSFPSADSLTMCKNDLFAMRKALIDGLKVNPSDIRMYGESGTVKLDDLRSLLFSHLKLVKNEDTLIFYFSGHGGKDCLFLSDEVISLDELIKILADTNCKNKIVMLDCCYAGGFKVSESHQFEIDMHLDDFVGNGIAILASCKANEVSGFEEERKISRYTSYLCDAMTCRYLIRKGKKSLEMINEAVFHYAAVWNTNNITKAQHPIFRSNIGGTIFFNVETYVSYSTAQFYEETDKYIIYAVEPLHNSATKRLCVKVILRFKYSFEEIAILAKEIQDKVRYYEVYDSIQSEQKHSGKPANIIFCYFAYDEEDVVDGRYLAWSTWVDDSQDKKHWYRESETQVFVDDVHFHFNNSYKMLKSLSKRETSAEKIKATTLECTAKLINAAEKYVAIFREYTNETISEDDFINDVEPLNKEISKWFFKQSELPLPPLEMQEWAQAHINISCTIHDFSLFYDKSNVDTWPSDNRKKLMSIALKRYGVELERLKDFADDDIC